MYTEELLKDIEIHRAKMVELAAVSSFSNHQVVKASIELDNLINRYYTLTLKKEA